jgi:hypothetical protein
VINEVRLFRALITKLNRYFLITLKDSEAHEEIVGIPFYSE